MSQLKRFLVKIGSRTWKKVHLREALYLKEFHTKLRSVCVCKTDDVCENNAIFFCTVFAYLRI